MKKQKSIPFAFVLEQLEKLDPVIKPMFGCYSVYINNKIMLTLRHKENNRGDNGVWVATMPQHHESLKKDLPGMRPLGIFGFKNQGWQIIPEEADTFEESVTNLCELILKRDPRIGKIPKARKKKSV